MAMESRPVGYYRTTTETDFRLTANDLALAEACFNNPHHVFLLIRPLESGAPVATFFFRDSRGMSGDLAFLEFSLDPAILASHERQRILRLQTALLAERVAAGTASPAAAPTVVVKPAPVATLTEVEKPTTAAAPVEVAKPTQVAAPPELARLAAPRSAQPSQARLALKYAAAAVVICGVVIGAIFLYENLTQFRAGSAPAGSQPVVTSPVAVAPMPAIGLRAARQNGDLLLTWNRDAAPVARASSALLVIQDGQSERQIPLNAKQIQSGSVLYSPVSEQIQMQLTVTSPASSVSESVLVILPKAGPPQIKLQATKRTPEPPANMASAPEESAPVRALKPFTAPAPAAKAPQTAAIDDVPALATGLNQSAPARLPLAVSAPQVVRPQAPPPPAAEPAAAPAAPPLVRSEYHPPEALTKVVPQFPQALRAIVVKPKTVQVRVSIDDKGKVTKVEPLRQPDIHGMLIEESVRAARGWRFRPARQGSQAVPSEMVLSFAFNTNIYKDGSQE